MNENFLPGIIISRDSNKVSFLCDTADLCFSFGNSGVMQHVQTLFLCVNFK